MADLHFEPRGAEVHVRSQRPAKGKEVLDQITARGTRSPRAVEIFDEDFEEWIDLEPEADLPVGSFAIRLKHSNAKGEAVTGEDHLSLLFRRLTETEEELHRAITTEAPCVTSGVTSGVTTSSLCDEDSLDINGDAASLGEGVIDSPPLSHEDHADEASLLPPVPPPVSGAYTAIDEVTVDAAFKLHEAGLGRDVFFVDVREKTEALETGLVSGATRAHRALLEWHSDPSSPLFNPVLLSGKKLVLYASGNVTEGMRPGLAAHTLAEMGIPNILVMKEGIRKWKERGYPVAYDETQYDVQVTITPTKTAREMILEATKTTQFLSVPAAAELLHNPHIVFVDVRGREEVEKTGVIQGAAIASRELIEWYTDPKTRSHHKLFNPLFISGHRLVLYGGGMVGGGRPILACATLQKVLPYHANVCVLEGGFHAWEQAGLPIQPVDTNASPVTIENLAAIFPPKQEG